jgi:hypothetical protein
MISDDLAARARQYNLSKRRKEFEPMHYIPRKPITAVVCVSALCAFFTMARVTAQEKRAASAQEKPDTKVLLQNAMNHLEEARSDLKSADTDREGHKIKAETSVDSAMNEVRAALKADYPGKK